MYDVDEGQVGTTQTSHRGGRCGSAATGAGRRRPAARSRSRKVAPARPRGSRGDGRTVVIPTSRRAVDGVAGPRPRERAIRELQAVLGAVKSHRSGPGAREAKCRRRGVGAREATGGPWECGLLGGAADVVSCPRSSTTKSSRQQLAWQAKRLAGQIRYRRLQRQPKTPSLASWHPQVQKKSKKTATTRGPDH